MATKTRIIKFYSDSAFAHFKDAAEWRHTANNMVIDDRKLEIEFTGNIDPVLEGIGQQDGGVWDYKRKDDDK